MWLPHHMMWVMERNGMRVLWRVVWGGDGRGLFQPIKLGRTSRTDVRLLTSVVDVELATDLLENHRLVYSCREGRRTNYWTNLITFTDRTYVLSEDLISETAFLWLDRVLFRCTALVGVLCNFFIAWAVIILVQIVWSLTFKISMYVIS